MTEAFQQMGYEVVRHRYQVLIPQAHRTSVEMIRPFAHAATLQEPPIDVDLDTSTKGLQPPMVAFSPDGDVEGWVVYVGHGTRQDFVSLESEGVSVRDRICIASFGRNHPASMAALAEEYGARALLYYSDPSIDGYAVGDVYPDGGFRPTQASRRVTALRFFETPGDPGTPGWTSKEGAERLPDSQMKSLPRLPLAVLSAADAQPILESLRGQVVPLHQRGALPITYHRGGTRHTVVRLSTQATHSLLPIDVLEARWPRASDGRPFILVGADRDAWVHDASGSGGATAVLLETAQLVAERIRAGARFARDIQFMSWDASVLGGIGQAEWAEQFRNKLTEQCVAHIDIPHGARGANLDLRSSPQLSSMSVELRELISAPGDSPPRWHSIETEALPAGPRSHLITEHAIPTLSIETNGTCGLEGSGYDTLGSIRRHVDPGLVRHAALAGVVAAASFRLAEAPAPPLHLGAWGWTIADHCQKLEQALPSLDLTALKEVATRIGASGDQVQQKLWALNAGDLASHKQAAINQRLRATARLLVRGNGPSVSQPALLDINPDNANHLRLFPSLEAALQAMDRRRVQVAAEDLLDLLSRYAVALDRLNVEVKSLR